ncbi:longitudinals lacking protein isoform X2 [Spodoptera frugiperda]|uniref:Longitudinals lacking protein isoform X2 n=1 Tax=Spodoptera frugiperda TaxID=7108 RepID=A0A9R0D9J6_SPOFR|nr:longitudinals lacking protein isoform X2 [Spodoptera frugiperda]
MDDDQQFCLRWNNHQSTLVSVFDTLLEKGMHVDCTLAAEGQTLKAHKVVLSACSPYFESVLSQQYDKHPIIILKDVKYAELRAMMDYMYRGEVNISQDQLAALLKAAESLQIKGLSDNKPSRPPSRPAQAVAAHPPRAPSPPPQVRDGSIDSREGSVSPTRRRKKARRMSSEIPPVPIPPPNDNAQGNGEDAAPCKEELQRDGVEDLTLDEETDDQPAVAHNDVVRNFQWHMERSQDDLMNSSDSARESQGQNPTLRHSIVTRSKKVDETTTLAILKTVKSPPPPPVSTTEETKENKKLENKSPKPVTPKPSPKVSPKASPDSSPERGERGGKTSPYNILPPASARLECAQYKTEKGYRCPKCQRCYNARKNLVRHVTLECGREPQYKCPYCAYSKHRRNELKKHIDKKHPDQPSLGPK